MDIPCSLPDTQSQSEVNWSQNDVEVPTIWGWLYPARLHLQPLDLTKSTIILGRSPSCDLVFSGKNLSPNVLRIISKEHFKIFREQIAENESSFAIYLEDLSYNGTFVNEQRIGRGNKILLQNEDIIAVGHPTVKIYVFKCIFNSGDLPKEISSKYVVSTKLLGTGACGEVKLVWNKRTCEKYAMKKIIKSKISTIIRKPQVNDAKRIMNEVNILKSLNHPFIIHCEDIVDTDNAVYIILELMEGGELFDRIVSNDKIPEFEAKLIFYQIVLAVKYLHNQGITHRDLKPENILLSSHHTETVVKVSDFGLSKFIDEESVLKTVCGTPMYVAPEILLTQGRGTYTKQVDVWSLGVILYVLVSGYLPFTQGDANLSLSEQIIKGRYSFPRTLFKDISEEVINLIKSILVVDPIKRLNISQILKHPWFEDEKLHLIIDKLLGNDKTLVDIDLNTNGSLYEPPSKKCKTEC